MALGTYFIEDIRNALLAANEAGSAAAEIASGVEAMKHYHQGYKAALVTVALAFGISPAAIAAPCAPPATGAPQDVESLFRIAEEAVEERG